MHSEQDISTCPNTGATIFRTPAHIRDMNERFAAIEAENLALRRALGLLIASQPSTVRSKLPDELRQLAQNPPSIES